MSAEHPAVRTAAALADSAGTADERRVLLTLMAFAAGDAYGVTYEYLSERVPIDLTRIGGRAGWPPGGVSDDTSLSLLTIDAVRAGRPGESAEAFLRATRAALPRLRGLGPTTRAALGLPPASDEGLVVVGSTVVGNTNGAMMRTALLGLGYSARQDLERRAMVEELARATHPAPMAVACAVLCSALYSRALELAPEPLIDTLRAEMVHVNDVRTALEHRIDTFDRWSPPAAGVPLDPLETLSAVVWVAGRATDPLAAFGIACEIGGDTDTVAALAGGLVCARDHTASPLDISWIDDVQWSEIPDIATAARRLVELRADR